jgi:hypothetical protein
MSMSHLGGHGSLTYGSAWVEPMEMKRTSVSRVLALAKVEPLEASEQHWGAHNELSRGLTASGPTRSSTPSASMSIRYNMASNSRINNEKGQDMVGICHSLFQGTIPTYAWKN